ncbi:MAG: prepilin peptidase [Streptococcus sp.]|nr:prepilin peptidase [Streptococcus sp.]
MIHFYFFLMGTATAPLLKWFVNHFSDQTILSSPTDYKHWYRLFLSKNFFSFFSKIAPRQTNTTYSFPFSIGYHFFKLGIGLLFLLTSLKVIDLSQLVLLIMGVILALYDQKYLEYPVFIWFLFHCILCILTGWNITMLFFLFVGILAIFINLRIGAGDFLFLSSCATIFSLNHILIIIQIACLLGFIQFGYKKKKDRIAFIPCLFSATVFLIFYKLLLLR